MNQVIDLTGLPAEKVAKVRNYADALRKATTEDSWSPLSDSEWLAEWNAFKASHTHVTGVADDSRESIYSDDRP